GARERVAPVDADQTPAAGAAEREALESRRLARAGVAPAGPEGDQHRAPSRAAQQAAERDRGAGEILHRQRRGLARDRGMVEAQAKDRDRGERHRRERPSEQPRPPSAHDNPNLAARLTARATSAASVCLTGAPTRVTTTGSARGCGAPPGAA